MGALLDGDLAGEPAQQVAFSVATAVCAPGSVSGYHEVSRMLAGLRRHAKAVSGTSWVLHRVGEQGVELLRGQPATSDSPATDHHEPATPNTGQHQGSAADVPPQGHTDTPARPGGYPSLPPAEYRMESGSDADGSATDSSGQRT